MQAREAVLSLSYGKDSLACLGAIEQLGWPLDRIVHAEVWATDTIPADLPPMVEFKKKADRIIYDRWGIQKGGSRMNKTKAERARELRCCRKPVLASMEYDLIELELEEISRECDDIDFTFDSDPNALLDAMDGDDSAVKEFRMAFVDLGEKVRGLQKALRRREWALRDENYDPAADFNSCLSALVGDFYKGRDGGLFGWDSVSEEYYELDAFDADFAIQEAVKRLCRKTKAYMVKSIQTTLRIFLSMIDIREEFDYINNAIDIAKEENMALAKLLLDIDNAYEAAEKISDGFKNTFRAEREIKEFDRLLAELPERCWVC